YTALVPAPIRDLKVSLRLDEARAALARLTAAAARASRGGGRGGALLGVECLASAQLVRVVGQAQGRTRVGGAVGAGADGLLARFERACAAGVRADRLDVAAMLAAHRRIVPGGGAVRAGPVWVGGGSDPNAAVFVGPPAGQVPRLLADVAA